MPRDMRVVYLFELRTMLRKKGIVIATVVVMALLIAVASVPTIMSAFGGFGPSSPEPDVPGIAADTGEEPAFDFGFAVGDDTIDIGALTSVFPFAYARQYPDKAALQKAIEEQEITRGVWLSSMTAFALIAEDLPMYDRSGEVIADSLAQLNRDLRLRKSGIDPAVVRQAEDITIDIQTETIGKNAASGYVFAYIGMFMIYMLILLYGSLSSTAVAREKNDRTMELLITSTSSTNLIWGKVLACVTLSTAQIVLFILAGVAGVALNAGNYPPFLLKMVRDGVSAESLVLFVVFALFGTLLYYFLYGAVGALVSKVEDVAGAVAPIQYVFIAAFILNSVGINMPGGTLMRVLSIVPFTSPMAMFIRYSMASVHPAEVALALALLILTAALMARIAVRVYRMGTLSFGNRIGFFQAVGTVLRKEDRG